VTFSLDGWRSWFGEMACFFMAKPASLRYDRQAFNHLAEPKWLALPLILLALLLGVLEEMV
jgi:hypothetical protein